jgi:predicted ATPase
MQFQGSPYHTNTALYPAINVLREAAGLTSQDSAQAQLDKLDVMASESGIDNQEAVSLFADLLSIPGDHRYPPLTVSSETRKDMTLEALVQRLHRLADRSPVLFIVEDAHWLDPTTLDLLTRIINRIRQMRVLVLITFRPHFKPVWADYSHVTSLTLSRLPRRQSAELMSALTGGKALPSEVQQAILAKTDGVPLYIEALTDNVLGSGLLTEGNKSFTLKGPLTGLPIPDSLQALLMERVDRLGPAKGIVQTGAAIGREFTYELVRATVDATDSQLRQALDRFVSSGRPTTLSMRSSKTRPIARSPRNLDDYSMLESPKRWRVVLPSVSHWNRNSWPITMNRQDWPARLFTIGNWRLGEMWHDQPISKRSIILIGRSTCSRICRKARSAMPWSWNFSLHAGPPCCP